jgi:Tfp pilus assembly protein PilO
MNLNNIEFTSFIELFNKVLNKESIKKLSIYLFLSCFFIIVFYIFFYLILTPKKQSYEVMQSNKTKISEIKSINEKLDLNIKKLEPIYKKQSALFHNKNDVEELYRSISISAAENNLVITSLQKNKIISVFEPEDTAKKKVYYYKIPITYEIAGDFLNYVKFKKFISNSKKIINIEEEKIILNKNSTNGKIIAKGQLSVAGLPYELF